MSEKMFIKNFEVVVTDNCPTSGHYVTIKFQEDRDIVIQMSNQFYLVLFGI